MNRIQLKAWPKRRPRTAHKVALTLAVALIALVCALQLPGPSWANEETTVSIEPPSQQIEPGETISTTVYVTDVADLFGFQFTVSFDTAVVKVLDVDAGDFLVSAYPIVKIIDNSGPTGTAEYGLFQQGGTGQTGDGILAVITWEGVGTGTSVVYFEDLLLGDSTAEEIPATAQHGDIGVTGGMSYDYAVYAPLIVKGD